MPRFTILIEVGWCGFGWSGELFPELRLGYVRFACCADSALDRLNEAVKAIKAGAVVLRRAS